MSCTDGKCVRICYEGKIGDCIYGNSVYTITRPYSPRLNGLYLAGSRRERLIYNSPSPRISERLEDELPTDTVAEAGGARPVRNRDKPVKRTRSRGGKNIIFRVYPEEHAAIAQRASEAGLTMSEFIRRVVEGHATYSRYDYDVLEKLIAVHADMNRLGNLFKMAIRELKNADRPWEYADHERSRLRSVLASIESNQELLLNYIGEFKP